jgi:hypothetical protein
MGKLNYSLRASTLVESIVAMVIITLAICTTWMIYVSVLKSRNPFLEFKAYTALKEAIYQSKKPEGIGNQSFEFEGFRIEKSVVLSPEHSNVMILEIQVINSSNIVIHEYKQLLKSQDVKNKSIHNN